MLFLPMNPRWLSFIKTIYSYDLFLDSTTAKNYPDDPEHNLNISATQAPVLPSKVQSCGSLAQPA
jgi:hypothetical protein